MSIATVMKSLCDPMVMHRKDEKSTGSRNFEEPPWDFTSHDSMWALVSAVLAYVSLLQCFQNSNISPYWTLCCNWRIYVITLFYTGYMYVMYYCNYYFCNDPGKTNQTYLKAGCHNGLAAL
jgi:hypothetical protein